MSAILEHFKPPPSASDPPAKTKYWPAPPKGSTGGILQKTESVASSNGSQYPSSPVSRVSFAPLPDLTTRKRRNSITLGVAARSATLRAQRMGPHPPPPRRNGYGPSGPAPGRPRRRAADHYKDDQVIDLGEVAIDAGKKLWRVISRKASMASDSGRPDMHALNHKAHMHEEMGGPTVGATGHNTEREISVRGFAVPEDDEDEEDEDDEDDEDEDDEDEDEAEEAQHRTEDYVAGVQAMHISAGNITAGDGVEPCHPHPTRLSPPPLSRSETDSSPGASAASTPSMSHEREPPLDTGKDSLF